ncbi:MAG: response regulator [Methylococcaceae bacterium]
MKVIIIEDEPLVHEELICQLEEFDDVDVVAECGDVFSALRAVRKHLPDVMFLDIKLPGHDGSYSPEDDGFSLLDCMEKDEHRPHVVVVSGGTTDYAVRAFGEGVLDYLEKPVEEDRLKKTMDRIREQLAIQGRKALPYPDRKLEFIPCIYKRRFKFVKPEDVDFVRSDPGMGVHVVCGEKEYYTELTLKTLLEKTDLKQCHRQYLINLSAVDEYERIENGLATIHTESGKTVPVSKFYRGDIEKLLGLK